MAEGLKDGNQRTVAAVVWAMSSAKNYPASMLYNLLEETIRHAEGVKS